MTYPAWIRRLAWLAVLLVPIWLAAEIDARGRGGGGGRGRGGGGRPSYSSRGPAMGGSIRGSGTRARPTTRPATRPATSRPATTPATRPATKPGAGGSGVAQRPAQGGSATKPATGGQRPAQQPGQGGTGENRPDREEGREDWQDFANEQQEDRQQHTAALQHNREEWWEEEGGHYYDGNEASMWLAAGMMFAVGATLTAAAVSSLSCTMSPAVVAGTTYYRCGNQWYSRAFTNGEVTYVVINPPAGS